MREYRNLGIARLAYQRDVQSTISVLKKSATWVRCAWSAAAVAFLAIASSGTLGAQAGNEPLFVGSEMEQYIRFAQSMSAQPVDPWSIRGFSPLQEKRLRAIKGVHPWSARVSAGSPSNTSNFTLLPVQARFVFNSAFPFGSNDGAVWAGKGLTSIVQGGISAQWAGFSLVLAPIFSRAENSAFDLMNNGATGRLQFGDGQFPNVIDRPQRFGASAYQLVDPGQSTLQYAGHRFTAGVSTANQSWGPAEKYQFILGSNAAGYAHLFVGTETPANIGIGRAHARFVWGMLEQSPFSPVSGPQYFQDGANSGRRRFTSGLVATLQPRGVPGMEIGFSRFFHMAWPKEGLSTSDFTGLFQNVFKKGLPKEAPLPGTDNTQGVRDNQLVSIFTRWVVPETGFEVYGEFGREDHSFDLRDFLQEPDHGGSSRMVGLRKMWQNGYALRAEAINYEAPQATRLRPEGAVYLHYVLRQGHTNKGQPLGADVGVGSGAGSFVAVDKYTDGGRTTVSWSRAIGHQGGTYYLGGPENTHSPDVLQTLSGETVRFRGPMDVTAKLNLTMNFNRNFRSDVFNLGLQVGSSYRF